MENLPKTLSLLNRWRSRYGKQMTVLGLIVFFLVISFSPSIYEWNVRGRTKPNRYFELVHNFPTDYNFYLSRIRQGKEGAWLATEKYTSEPHEASLSQALYVLIGRVSDWAHIQTPYTWFSYHVMRIFFSAFFLYVVWRFVAWHGKHFSWQMLTFLVVVTASTWPKFESVRGIPRFGSYMAWWTQANELQRTTFMPHVMLGQALLVFVLWVFAGGFISRKHPANYIFLGVVGLIMGVVFPPALMFTYAVLGVYTAGEIAGFFLQSTQAKTAFQKKRFKEWFADAFLGRVIFGVMTAPSLLYYTLLFRIYPWKRLVEYDALHPPPFKFGEYFMALGPTLPLGVLGALVLLIHVRTKHFRKYSMVLAWVVAWFAVLFVFTFIPQQSPMRFGQMVPNVPLGILTMYLFIMIAAYLKKVRTLRPFLQLLFFIPITMIVVGLLNFASSYMWLKDFVDHKLRADIPLVPKGAEVMYPLTDQISAMKWLEGNTPRDAVVMADEPTGNYIPVYSGNTVYVGHANTVRLETKTAEVRNFYRNQLGHDAEMAWLLGTNIDYIFYGPGEKEYSGWIADLREQYPELLLMYENEYVKIYKVPR